MMEKQNTNTLHFLILLLSGREIQREEKDVGRIMDTYSLIRPTLALLSLLILLLLGYPGRQHAIKTVEEEKWIKICKLNTLETNACTQVIWTSRTDFFKCTSYDIIA